MLQPMFFITLQKATLLMSILDVAWRNRIDSVSDYYTKDKSQVITIAAATVAVSVVAFLLTLLLAFQSFLYFIPCNLSSTRWLTKYYFSAILTVPFKLWHCSHYQHLGYFSNYAYFFGPISGNKASREKILIITAPSIFVLLVVTVSVYWYFRYLCTQRQPARGQYYLIFAKLLRSFTSSTRQRSQLFMLFQVLV